MTPPADRGQFDFQIYSGWLVMLMTVPSGARTKNRRRPHASFFRKRIPISYPRRLASSYASSTPEPT